MRVTVSQVALAISLVAVAAAAPRAEAAESLPSSGAPGGPTAAPASNPTAVEANAFLARAEWELTDLSVLQSRASWVNSTYITDDTDALAAHFAACQTEMAVRFAVEAARYRYASGLNEDA
jgi:peptidyl-dipeptidase A